MNSLNNDIHLLYNELVTLIDEVNITKLYNLLVEFQIEVNFSALRAVFQKFDIDQDGILSELEFANMIKDKRC